MYPDVQMPANPVIECVLRHPEACALGRKLNSLYGRLAVKKQFDAAWRAAHDFLAQYSPPMQRAILMGAILSAHLNRSQCSVIWQYGPAGPDGRRQPGIHGMTEAALSEIGMAVRTVDGRQVYYSPAPACYAALRLTSVWFFYYQEYARIKGLPVPEHYADIPDVKGLPTVTLADGTQRLTRHWAMERIRAKVDRGDFLNRPLTLRSVEDDKLGVFNEQDVRLGNVSRKKSDPVQPGCVVLRLCFVVDDDLSCIADLR